MSPLLLVAIAAVTYASRAAAFVLLPRPGGRFAEVLGRMPAPLFASLAALTLVTDHRSLAAPAILCAALGALALAPRRSLALSLVGGLAGYGLGALLF